MTGTDSNIFEHAPLILASRKSELAMIQTRFVQAQLSCPSKIIGLSTKGDEILDRPLVDIGGKGVFIKTLEAALLSGQADAAVHSMKDMETSIAADTKIVAVLKREDRRDALVGPYQKIDDLPENAHVGTASVRRSALLRNIRPDLKISLLRGNVGSRLARLKAGEFDAIILAVAGLKRLGISTGYTALDEAVMPAAAAQGALAIQIRTGDARAKMTENMLSKLNCADTATCVQAERALLAGLDGSCRTPISAMANITKDQMLHLQGCILSEDGAQRFSADITGTTDIAEQLGQKLAEQLLRTCGGRSFLA